MILSRRSLMLGASSTLLSGVLPSLATETKETKIIGGLAFGSWWRAVLPFQIDALEIKIAIEAVIASVDNAMSPFKNTSEISRLNGAIDTDWHPISLETGIVIYESLRIARLTNGAFDPTVGPLVGRFGFGPITGSSITGYQSIQFRENKLRKTIPQASLDLCGIAKGYALDRMADILSARNVTSYLLEAGGEVLARGHHPQGRQWQVGIQSISGDPSAFQRIVKLDGVALATSGDAVNGGKEGGISFNHIIDPQTELPLSNGVASVSVICETAMQADALATAFMVMGSKTGLALAEQEGIAVLFLIREPSGISEIMSNQFSRYIVI
ncbi:MAG: FAD:protein FMN transferase [Devosiaceae bacterium]|nr:FAD:protein FMN transferase [Devosiaceae bacterium]